MGHLLSRARFVELVARRLDVSPSDLAADDPAPLGLDPAALLRLDEIVSAELGVELPEQVLKTSSSLDEIYDAYVMELVATDLRATGTDA